ncbi:MAG: DUF2384 domain-containing protein [Deltaproteobacteria bacterium]|nr:DUF2384 domain-containing protein [Deltaproteobacteria bacterium]
MAHIDTKAIVSVLGGPKTVGNVRTLHDLADRVRSGLPWASFTSVQACFQVQADELRKVALLSNRTLSRRRGASFAPDESDRLLRLARVFAHALQVFEEQDKAARWMTRSNRALGGVVPMTLLDTDIGAQEVDEALGRIEHGILA